MASIGWPSPPPSSWPSRRDRWRRRCGRPRGSGRTPSRASVSRPTGSSPPTAPTTSTGSTGTTWRSSRGSARCWGWRPRSMSNAAAPTTPPLAGIVAALLTPMRDGGTRIDPEAASRLASWLVERGVHGLYVAGTTGEGLYLTPEEHRELTQAVVKAARGIPVAVHVGARTTTLAVQLARQAVQAEATAVAAIPPPYYSLRQEELLAYFTAIGKAAEPLPLYLYNIPSHARNDLPPALVREIRRAVPTLAGIKDSSGFPGRIADLIRTMGPDFAVVCGNDEMDLAAFRGGAAGVVASGAG